MFKWLKKVMISIINAIKTLFVGDRPVHSVSIGGTQVYPYSGADDPTQWNTGYDGNIRKIKSINIAYFPNMNSSSDSTITMIGAEGSNNGSAKVACIYAMYDLYDYTGLQKKEENQWMYCPIDPNTLPSWLHMNGYFLYADSRGSVQGDVRTAQISCPSLPSFSPHPDKYQLTSGVSLTVTVSQQANQRVYNGSEVTEFEIDEYVDGDTITFEGDTQRLTVTAASGIRRYSWTSGADADDETFNMSQTSNFWQNWELVNVDSASWVHFGSGSEAKSIDIDSYTGNTYREARISFRDYHWPNLTDNIPVIKLKQTALEWELFASNATVEGTVTQPTITITSKHYGSVYTNLTVTVVSSDIPNLQYSGCSGSSNGQVTLNFTCGTNSGSSNKTASIRIYQNEGGNTRTITLTQKPFSAAFDGIDVKAQTADGQWVLGEITETGTNKVGYILAKNTTTYLSTGTYNIYIGTIEFWEGNNTTSTEYEGGFYMTMSVSSTGDVTLTDYLGHTHGISRDIYINRKYYYGCWIYDRNGVEMSPDRTPALHSIVYVESLDVSQGT